MQYHHTKRELRGQYWGTSKESQKEQAECRVRERSRVRLGPGKCRRAAKRGEFLLSVGAVRAPWDSGAVEWSQPGQREPQVPLDETDKVLG